MKEISSYLLEIIVKKCVFKPKNGFYYHYCHYCCHYLTL